MGTFKGGVQIQGRKSISKSKSLIDMAAPKNIYIPLSQHIGAPAELVVAKGDYVKAGTLIGKAKGYISANVFASVSGIVQGIVQRPNAQGNLIPHVHIENDFQYEQENLEPLREFDKETILQRIKDAGIVGMGGATFPSHVKFVPPKQVDSLIINCAECEPYITCDYRIMLDRTNEVIQGANYIRIALGVENVYFGIEKNKQDAIDKFRETAIGKIKIVGLKTKYPQGAEKQMIAAVLKRKVPAGKLPADVGAVVVNLQTCYSIYKAVLFGRPSYKRALTVTGMGVQNPGNFWVRVGVPYSFLFDQCKGHRDGSDVKKIVSGGPMMGFAQANLDTVVTKGTSALLFLTEKEIETRGHTACINCAKCAKHCPMNLRPMLIDQCMRADNASEAKRYGVMSCIECGCCAYVCPAKRPLVQSMRLAKKVIKEQDL